MFNTEIGLIQSGCNPDLSYSSDHFYTKYGGCNRYLSRGLHDIITFFFISGDGYCVKLQYHKNYNGTSNRTLKGLTCQRWDSQDPHRHQYNDSNLFSEDTLGNAENFCRTPDGSDWPWCFTTELEVRSQPCDIDVKLCGGGITSGIM